MEWKGIREGTRGERVVRDTGKKNGNGTVGRKNRAGEERRKEQGEEGRLRREMQEQACGVLFQISA